MDSVADCGGAGRVVSCGYDVSVGANAQVANLLVQQVVPFAERDRCRAILTRTADAGSTAGATIRAVAICLA